MIAKDRGHSFHYCGLAFGLVFPVELTSLCFPSWTELSKKITVKDSNFNREQCNDNYNKNDNLSQIFLL